MPSTVGGKNYRSKYRKLRSKWYNKKYSVGDLASKAWSGVKMLKGIINSEKHTLDTGITSGAIDYNGSVTNLNSIAQGDTRVNRQGRTVLAKYLSGRIAIYNNATAGSCTVRLFIVCDKMNQGSAPSVSDILEGVGANTAPLSALKQINTQRFKILWSRLTTTDTNNPIQLFKYYLPMSTHLYFDGANATDYQKNALFLVMISDQQTNTPSINLYNRLAFYDN